MGMAVDLPQINFAGHSAAGAVEREARAARCYGPADSWGKEQIGATLSMLVRTAIVLSDSTRRRSTRRTAKSVRRNAR